MAFPGGPIRRILILFVLALTMVACGGEESADTETTAPSTGAEASVAEAGPTTTTTAPTTTTTIASTAGDEGSELCEVLLADLEASGTVDVFDPEAFEAGSRESIAGLESIQGTVPPELEESVAVILDAYRDWAALLDEHGWDITAVPEDDPRFTALSSEEVVSASETLTDYCGLAVPGDEPADEGQMGELEGLMPPEAGEVLGTEPILIVESSMPYEALVDHYEQVLGRAPVNENQEEGGRIATFIAQYGEGQVGVWVEETPDGAIVEISAGSP